MANATNSNMNIPNTFNLTGTWQNNVDPISNRTSQAQNQQQLRNLNNNTLPESNNSSISQNNNNLTPRQNNLQNPVNTTGIVNLRNPVEPQNFNNNQNSQQSPIGLTQNLQNSPNSNTCTNCQNSDAQTLSNFAKSQIGRNTTVEFLIGNSTLIEKSGNIVSVGENYILLNETGTRSLVACDLNNIKFIYFDY